jgi:hypothetical protein
MEPYQQRVVDEKTELDAKREKLTAFIQNGDVFNYLPDDEQRRLERQDRCMTEYSNILGERIANFGG